jgi:hypothetical protein
MSLARAACSHPTLEDIHDATERLKVYVMMAFMCSHAGALSHAYGPYGDAMQRFVQDLDTLTSRDEAYE